MPTADDIISSGLAQAGLDDAQIRTAINGYHLIANKGGAVISRMIAGQPVDPKALLPLVAGGLAVTGVGVLPAAAIMLGLQTFIAIGDLLSPGVDCTGGWWVGSTCIAGRRKPSGPNDPSWYTWEDFSAGSNFACGLQCANGPPTVNGYVTGAFPYYWRIGQDLSQIPSPAALAISGESAKLIDQFRYVYYRAWQKNAEFFLNGYQGADPYDLLKGVVAAWNQTRSDQPPPGGAYGTWCLQADNPGGDCGAGPKFPSGFIGDLMNGEIDGQRKPSLRINVGQLTPEAAAVIPTVSSGASVAKGALVLAGLGLGGAAVYSFVTKKSFVGVLKTAWRKTETGFMKVVRR